MNFDLRYSTALWTSICPDFGLSTFGLTGIHLDSFASVAQKWVQWQSWLSESQRWESVRPVGTDGKPSTFCAVNFDDWFKWIKLFQFTWSRPASFKSIFRSRPHKRNESVSEAAPITCASMFLCSQTPFQSQDGSDAIHVCVTQYLEQNDIQKVSFIESSTVLASPIPHFVSFLCFTMHTLFLLPRQEWYVCTSRISANNGIKSEWIELFSDAIKSWCLSCELNILFSVLKFSWYRVIRRTCQVFFVSCLTVKHWKSTTCTTYPKSSPLHCSAVVKR